MRLVLQREPSRDGATLGELLIDGVHECWTLEDVMRPAGEKVPGATAIPAGIYTVDITWSPRFQRDMPLLVGVPGFDGVRIHIGNSPADTEGCILVGQGRGAGLITSSRAAFDALWQRIADARARGETITIEVRDPLVA